jgi:hypothetical protein
MTKPQMSISPELLQAALLATAHQVVRTALATDTPVIISLDGQIVEVDPRTIHLPPVPPTPYPPPRL